MGTSLLITTFNRNHLLLWGLRSIVPREDFEIIVLNDAHDNPDTKDICDRYGAHYIWTGHRHPPGSLKWRVPGFALNIGARLAKYETLILSCAEMYHINDCVDYLSGHGPQVLAIPCGWDDRHGRFLDSLENGFEFNHEKLHILKTELPFLMAVNKGQFFDIGGYDEDFTGQSYDDDDLVDRLIANGCRIIMTEGVCIHLYHDRNVEDKRAPGRLAHNKQLYEQRKGIIQRNTDHIWGRL